MVPKVKTICRSERGMHAGNEAGYLQSAAQLSTRPWTRAAKATLFPFLKNNYVIPTSAL